MSDRTISVDEFLNSRKAFVKSGDVLMKAFKAPPSWDDARRSARFVMSSETPDRDKDIIYQDGIGLDQFSKNPVALFAHNSWTFPIGTWENVGKVNGRPKRTEGDLVFLPAGEDDDADRAARHVKAGTLRAVSIGFRPKSIRRREQDAETRSWPGYEILECELMECSLVPIPAQPDAIVKAADGDMKLAREMIEEILDTWVKHPETGLIVPKSEYEAAFNFVTASQAAALTKLLEAANAKAGSVDLKPDADLPSGDEQAKSGSSSDDNADINRPKARSIIRRALDLVFGEENEAKLNAALQADAAEAEKAATERAARRKALADRDEALTKRLADKGLTKAA